MRYVSRCYTYPFLPVQLRNGNDLTILDSFRCLVTHITLCWVFILLSTEILVNIFSMYLVLIVLKPFFYHIENISDKKKCVMCFQMPCVNKVIEPYPSEI